MSEEIIVVEEEMVGSDTAVSPTETSRRLVMASIGAVVVVSGAVKSRVSRLIESEEAETEASPGRRRLPHPMNSLLTRLNMPTKTDIDALNDQVSNLLAKIEALHELEQRPSPPATIVSENQETTD